MEPAERQRRRVDRGRSGGVRLGAGPSFVLAGGGSFAVEIATYLADIYGEANGASGRDSAIVTDVVDSGTPRTADLERVVGGAIQLHQTFDTVENMEEKLALVAVGNAKARLRLFETIATTPLRLGQLVHPSAYVAPTAQLGKGVIICPLVYVGSLARIEDNAAVNTVAAIGHDAVLEHSSMISPCAAINGFARCGVASFVGAGAVLYPGAYLGNYSKLSAGSVLAGSSGEGMVFHGNPASERSPVPSSAT